MATILLKSGQTNFETNLGFLFRCDCSQLSDGTPCDANFDGTFAGTCNNGACTVTARSGGS